MTQILAAAAKAAAWVLAAVVVTQVTAVVERMTRRWPTGGAR